MNYTRFLNLLLFFVLSTELAHAYEFAPIKPVKSLDEYKLSNGLLRSGLPILIPYLLYHSNRYIQKVNYLVKNADKINLNPAWLNTENNRFFEKVDEHCNVHKQRTLEAEWQYLQDHALPAEYQEQFNNLFTRETQQLFVKHQWGALEKRGFKFLSREQAAVVVHPDMDNFVFKIPVEEQGIRPGNFSRIRYANELQEVIKKWNLKIKVSDKFAAFFSVTGALEKGVIVVARKLTGSPLGERNGDKAPVAKQPLSQKQFNDLRCLAREGDYTDSHAANILVNDGSTTLGLPDTDDLRKNAAASDTYKENLLKVLYPSGVAYKPWQRGYYDYLSARDYAETTLNTVTAAILAQHYYKLFAFQVYIAIWKNKILEKVTSGKKGNSPLTIKQYALEVIEDQVPVSIEDDVANILTHFTLNERNIYFFDKQRIDNQCITLLVDMLILNNGSWFTRGCNKVAKTLSGSKNYIQQLFNPKVAATA